MLKLKINKNSDILSNTVISIEDIQFLNNIFSFKTNNQITNSEVLIKRDDGLIQFESSINVIIDETKDDLKHYKTEDLKPLTCGVDDLVVYNIGYLLKITPNHTLIENRKYELKRKFNSENINLDGLSVGDYVLYKEFYVYKIINLNGILSLNSEYENLVNLVTIRGVGDITVITPITENGVDDNSNLLVDKTYSYLQPDTPFNNYIIEYVDNRFVGDGGLKSGTSIFSSNQFINLNIPQDITFNTNLYQTELVNSDFVNKIKNENVNPIIDMEKYVFTPYNKNSDNTFTNVNEIVLNFHFRDRDGSVEWNTSDSKYWNGFVYDEGNGMVIPKDDFINYGDEQSDLLGYLNFSNEDVLYRKSKLKKSFVRLLFYDTNDVNTQQLLYYSTIFIDSGIQYNKYVKNIESDGLYQNVNDGVILDRIDVNGEYIKKLDDNKRLSTQIVINDKYNNSKSSEGFYLYLFPQTFQKPYNENIYMKVEYNHAGYGKTIPFMMPVDGDGNIIHFMEKNEVGEFVFNKNFPITFIENDIDGAERVNFQKYLNSLYIKLELKYDCVDGNKFYGYYLPQPYVDNNNRIVLNLFEPKIQ